MVPACPRAQHSARLRVSTWQMAARGILMIAEGVFKEDVWGSAFKGPCGDGWSIKELSPAPALPSSKDQI